MIPALANYFIAMFKETPLALSHHRAGADEPGQERCNTYYRYIEPITLVGAFFLVISLFSVVLLRWLEHRYGKIESNSEMKTAARNQADTDKASARRAAAGKSASA